MALVLETLELRGDLNLPRCASMALPVNTLLAGLVVTLWAGAGQAQTQSLESQASDPTASLMSFQLQNFYSPELHNSGESANIVQFRSAIPFEFLGVKNIARLTLPYATDTASGAEGFQDMTVFNLAAFDRPWGRFGAGVVALLPTGSSELSAEKWGLGPALGFVARPRWGLFGVFNQNIFTVAGDDDAPDVNVSTLQPILSVALGDGWSVGTSDMTFAYDWDEGAFTSLPLGLKVSKLARLGGVPVQTQLSFEHDFYDDRVGPKGTLGLTFKLLLPRS